MMEPLEAVLNHDIVRVASMASELGSDDEDLLDLTLHTVDGAVEVTVRPSDVLWDVVAKALGLESFTGVQILLGGEPLDLRQTFAANFVYDNGVLSVVRSDHATSYEGIVSVAKDILSLNFELELADLLRNVRLNKDGTVKDWSLKERGLRFLPESFGNLVIARNLDLSGNEIESLPDDFARLTIGWQLNLAENILTTLPASFGNICVGGHLSLNANNLVSLPDSFSAIVVERALLLNRNQLTSLPDNFGRLVVGGNLELSSNNFTSLPESFGDLTVGRGGTVFLMDADMPKPRSYPMLKVQHTRKVFSSDSD